MAILLLAAASSLIAQTTGAPHDLQFPGSKPASNSTASVAAAQQTKKATKTNTPPKPFSRLAISGGVSTMGVNMQAAVNANRYMNLRATGNYFNYTVNDISVNSYTVDGKLNFATGGASVDFYPFPNHGFRLSPGVLFHNENAVSANVAVAGGTKLSLNDIDYYSSTTNPIKGAAAIGLSTQKPAFTMTTGWGNVISRKGGHWSFPFELGAAFIGTPAINVALTSGQACNAAGANCVNVATDATVQSNLQAQIAKYKNDLDPLKFYPIVSFGLAYNFRIR